MKEKEKGTHDATHGVGDNLNRTFWYADQLDVQPSHTILTDNANSYTHISSKYSSTTPKLKQWHTLIILHKLQIASFPQDITYSSCIFYTPKHNPKTLKTKLQ